MNNNAVNSAWRRNSGITLTDEELKGYEKQIFEAFIGEDWQLIRTLSISLEKECNLIGQVELFVNLFRLIQLIDMPKKDLQLLKVIVANILQSLHNLQVHAELITLNKSAELTPNGKFSSEHEEYNFFNHIESPIDSFNQFSCNIQ